MFQEQPSSQENTPVKIREEVIDLESILNNGGVKEFKVDPDSSKIIKATVTPKSVDIRPAENSPFFFKAEVDHLGQLVFNIFLKTKTGERDPDLPSGGELVTLAVNFLEKQHHLETLVATWKEGSDTFSQFLINRNANGQTDTEAAFNTWTGQNIAKKFGFTEIKDIYKDMRSDERVVIVKFARKPRDSA